MRHLDRFDSTSAPDDAKKAISCGATSFNAGQRKNALGFAATYTEIYACISAGLQALGADCVAVLWECNAGAHFA